VPEGRGGSLSYVIYTSGTTGKPKGVLTMHYNVTRVVRDTNYIDIAANDRILQLSNYAFDGSVFDIYGALLNGAALVMIGKDDVPAVDRLAGTITREAITVFFVTTALFNTLVDLDAGCLDGIRKVLFGGERVSVDHCRRALDRLGKGRIIHVYGPTETTVYASYHFIDDIEADAHTIPIGKPLANTCIYILDRYHNMVPIGITGEIAIGGMGNARGYLNAPELTAERFFYWPYKSNRTYISKKLYKTGDLARWLTEGSIEFIGRRDHQVKIRGFRIELTEIEARLSAYEKIKETAVLAIGAETADKYLCAYIVPAEPGTFDDSGATAGELKEYLAHELPDYMIPSFFVPLDSLPLTVNGKLDRKALPVPDTAVHGGRYTAPRGSVETRLADIWADVLNIDRVGIDDNFFDLGGHSLKATVLLARVHKALDVKIPLAELFKQPTIRGLAEFMEGKTGDRFAAVEPAEEREYYPLAPAQKRLYILQQTERRSTVYNIPAVLNLEGIIDAAKLEEAFRKLIQRHDSLRTSFTMQAGEPVQRIHSHVDFEVHYFNAVKTAGDGEGAESSKSITRDFLKPFNLSEAPLIRVGMINLSQQRHVLMVDMHHIITDGTSSGIVAREFMSFYSDTAGDLAPLPVQYKDFAVWLNSGPMVQAIKKQEAFWLEELSGQIPQLNLVTDFPRGKSPNYEGDVVIRELSLERSRAVKGLAKAEDVTVYMVLLALCNVLLSRLSGQEDILVGTPVAGRGHADLQPLIGMFVNTLVLRNYPGAERPFGDFLQEVKKRTLAAFENQDYPLEDLVEKVAAKRDSGRNPLFDVMFSMQNLDIPEVVIPGLRLTPYGHESLIAKFDLTLSVIEHEDKFAFIFEYRTSLFKKETIEEFANYFDDIIASVLENKDAALGDIDISIDLIDLDADSYQDSRVDQEIYEDFDF
jgi:amino acid adenylation domain-containing protein